MRSDVEIKVSAGDRARLEAIAAAPGSPQKHVWRARIILLSGDGVGTMAIARQAGVAKPTVWRWQERFMTEVSIGTESGPRIGVRKGPLLRVWWESAGVVDAEPWAERRARPRGSLGNGLGSGAVFEAPALVAGLDDVAMVGQPV